LKVFWLPKVSACELVRTCMANFMRLTVPCFWKQKLFMISFTKHTKFCFCSIIQQLIFRY